MVPWWLPPLAFYLGVVVMGLCAAGKVQDKRRCTNCQHYYFHDGPLCALREGETWLLPIWAKQDLEEWFCADWEQHRD